MSKQDPLPETPIAEHDYALTSLSTMKQVPQSPARPATPHCPPSIHEPPAPPPIPPRSLQRPVSMLTAPAERHLIALEHWRCNLPTSFYEPQEHAWGIAKAPAEERVEVVEKKKKKKKKGRYPWHKTRLLLRFMGSCFILTAIALVYLRFNGSYRFSDPYRSNDSYRFNDSYDFFTLWVYMVCPAALTYNIAEMLCGFIAGRGINRCVNTGMDGLFTIGLVGIGFRFVAEAHGVKGDDVIGAICILGGVLQAGVWAYGICSFCK
ncbi:hypothetical protein HBI25_058460 [Parastagonospora nodorum]|nr:hypothetical protein HBI95_072540 [Parastagonospora nodorum]KAH5339796.1 hypothetical protein HBI12_002720 [Parastagonospora nodorum]KAH5566995.1 hypothetical protein HBI25_058460 [Parastagonospora nodorum]KAH6400130.1 hypothetical protein HBI60_085510 [Parastagonospora nodorum]